MWTVQYEERLLEWAALREEASKLPLEEALHLIHDWWNTAPIVNNVIHFTDPDNWPLPWDLLAESAYCESAKCLGLAYTLILCRDDIANMHMIQDDCSTYLIVDEYTLGADTGTIKVEVAPDRILHRIDCDFLKNKINR